MFGATSGGSPAVAASPNRVLARYVAGEGYFNSAPVPSQDGGMWATEEDPYTFGTARSSGALVYIGRDGKGSVYPLPTRDSYPVYPTLGPDGTLWFDYVQGDGTTSTVDTGPALSRPTDLLGWRRADGAVGDTAIASGTAHLSITGLVAGSDGSLWFTAQNDSGREVYGRIRPDGSAATYQLPQGVSSASGLSPNPDGSVSLLDTGRCTLLRLNPSSGATISSTRMPDGPPYGYCGGPVSGPGGSRWVSTLNGQLVTTVADGRSTTVPAPPRLPGDGWRIESTAADPAGDLWLLTGNQPTPGNLASMPLLLRVGSDGVTRRFTPIPVGPNPASTYSPDLLREHPEYLDLDPQYVLIAADGAVWLAGAAAIDRLG